MNISLIAERYAKALFEMAQEKNVLEEVYSDIKKLSDLIRESKHLRLFLKAPIINPGKKKQIFNELFRDFNPVTQAFINLLAGKRREFTIGEVSRQFIFQYNRFKNIIPVTVRSAVFLDQDFRMNLKSVMSKYTDANIELVEEIDETVLGGFILEWNDMQYDASIRKQLERMRKGVARINLYIKGIEHGRH